jgi:hypothetical protein
MWLLAVLDLFPGVTLRNVNDIAPFKYLWFQETSNSEGDIER